MIVFRHFAPKRYHCLECGYSPLEIWAFTWNDEHGEEQDTPVLVCTNARGTSGCGNFFDPAEYDLKDDDLVDYVIEDEPLVIA